jgi:hypothetical protein
MYGIAHAYVGLNIRRPEVIKCAEHIVVISGRERELQKSRTRNLAGGAPAEEATFQQIFLAAHSGRRDLRRGPGGTLVLQQAL